MFAPLRCRVAGMAAAFAFGLLPFLSRDAIAQNPPTSIQQKQIDSDRALLARIRQRDQAYQDINALGSSINLSLGRALSLPCIDSDKRDELIAQANEALAKISAWRAAPDTYLETKDTTDAKNRNIDGLMKGIFRRIEALKLKQPCPPPTPKTAEPPAQPVSPAQPEPPAQGEAQCPLTVDELLAVKSLEEDILNTKARLKVLEDEDVEILTKISELGGLPPEPFQNQGKPVEDSDYKPGVKELKEKLDANQKLEKPEYDRIAEDRRKIFELQNKKPPCDNKAGQLPEPPLTPNVPSGEKTVLPGTDTIKEEGPKTRTETQTEQGKKHPKKESLKKVTTKRSRRAAKHPTDADNPAPAGMSPETAHTIGTIIDIGVGVGLSRSRGHTGGHDNRGDAPKRVTPMSDR
jgi:hypothetical protein